MNLKSDLDIIDPGSAVQNAYDQSSRNEWRKEQMYPWTIARHSVALSLGCKVILAIGPEIAEFNRSGTYSNALRDVVIVLWLSSLDTDQIIDLDCNLRPTIAMKRAYEWAEQNGIEYGSPSFLEGTQLLSRILFQVQSSFFQVDHEETKTTEPKKKDIV